MCLEMTETDSAVTEAGRFVSENKKMDVSKRIIRNLEPARPLRRINMNQVPQSYAEIKPVEKPDNIIKVENFYEILHLQSTSTQPKKKGMCPPQYTFQNKVERICYTRDFLLKMASCPMAKKKPEFLPEHPIVLENGRTNDVPRNFITNHNNNNNNNGENMAV
ncbi:uncharacterized protein C8orf88 homolog isoform X2 [Megalobrama amblycephala]|uniref:uncharacterized protein C8orf88 homolog isoform X2 n=1 Tax=Megalobrama amblycephala TaxID=75352 RepID=UPI00201470D5|nr:uncharacterized protein C8orf88 homolog isoform X2 [Megalobrama amblycephala]